VRVEGAYEQVRAEVRVGFQLDHRVEINFTRRAGKERDDGVAALYITGRRLRFDECARERQHLPLALGKIFMERNGDAFV
jgi:hypothetical protein